MKIPHTKKVAMANAMQSDQTNVLSMTDVSLAASIRLQKTMKDFGSDLSCRHIKALNEILIQFSQIASGYQKGRYAFALPCGGGKTQALIAWCSELVFQCKDMGVLVCASQVDALCDIKSHLLNNGVPERDIGLIHSKGKEARYPSTEDNHQRRILLVTHARTMGPTDEARYTAYKDGKRSLVIRDEALIQSKAQTLKSNKLLMGIGALCRDERFADQQDLKAYLLKCEEVIQTEISYQRDGRDPMKLKGHTRHPDILDVWSEKIRQHQEGVYNSILGFLAIANNPLRVALISSMEGGLISYDIVVPESFRNVAILDASYAIRRLEHLDKSIQTAPGFDGDIKRYNDVNLYFMKTRFSGREKVEEDFSLSKAKRTISPEVIETIKGIPADQAVLLFTFKHRGQSDKVDIKAVLIKDMVASGIDPDEKVLTSQGWKARINILTWGQETSTSDYKHCSNVIFIGLYHRSDADMFGAITGQMDRLDAPIDHSLIDKVQQGEILHSLYQAINRACCRDTRKGQALPTKVWLFCKDKEIPHLLRDKVMPGMNIKPWEAQFMTASESKIEKLSRELRLHMDYLGSTGVTKRSIREIKKDLLATDLPNQTFVQARDLFLAETDCWELEGRSLLAT